MSELSILNVGSGDTKLTFDKTKPEERKRAAEAVTDMLQRGFAILVQIGQDEKGPLFRRCESFDPETCEYIIVGSPGPAPLESNPAETRAVTKKHRSRHKTRLPADKTPAVAVGRTAGG